MENQFDLTGKLALITGAAGLLGREISIALLKNRCDLVLTDIRDENISALKKEGFIVLGVSPDGEKSHNKFIDKYNLQFDLLVDEDKKLCNAYGVWGRKKFMGRDDDKWGYIKRWKTHVYEALYGKKDHCTLLNNAIRKALDKG